MRNLSVYFKSTLVSLLNLIFFIPCFYLSITFFLVLIMNEAIAGKANEVLKEDLTYFIKRIYEFPETLFPNQQKKGMDLSGELSWIFKSKKIQGNSCIFLLKNKTHLCLIFPI